MARPSSGPRTTASMSITAPALATVRTSPLLSRTAPTGSSWNPSQRVTPPLSRLPFLRTSCLCWTSRVPCAVTEVPTKTISWMSIMCSTTSIHPMVPVKPNRSIINISTNTRATSIIWPRVQRTMRPTGNRSGRKPRDPVTIRNITCTTKMVAPSTTSIPMAP